jgi:glycosyltransferase involved in cell wall biosynthesis
VNILLLAPQPFYTERGTPIAVRLAATALVRAGHTVDIACYHEGEDWAPAGITLHRIAPPRFVRDVPIGFSWQKLVCDVWLIGLMWRLLRRRRYDVVHAVEEAVFPALLARRWFGFRLVYDMDSLMAAQLVQKWPALGRIGARLEAFERHVARRADRVLAVCPSLVEFARAAGGEDRVHLLSDVAFPLPADVVPADEHEAPSVDLRALFPQPGPLVLYVGNLERYQGVDLLLDAMARIPPAAPCNLAVVGGTPAARDLYAARATALGLGPSVRFTGPLPLAMLPRLLGQADVLCSPRLAGANTPMKVYSYLAAGRAIVATDIESHRQVLDADCASLVAPAPEALATALQELASDAELRARLGRRAQQIAVERHGYAAFERRLAAAYHGLQSPPGPRTTRAPRLRAPLSARDASSGSPAAPGAPRES